MLRTPRLLTFLGGTLLGAVALAQGAPSGAAVLLQDDFTAADGTSLDASRWAVLLTGTPFTRATVQGGEAELVFNSQAGVSARLRALTPAFADGGVVLRYRFVTNDVRGKLGLFLRGSNDWASAAVPTSGYENYAWSDLQWFVLSDVVDGGESDRVSFTFTPNTGWHWVRFEAAGSEYRSRTWDAGGVEPADWPLHVTDSTPHPPGVFQLSWARASSQLTVQLDDVTVYAWGVDGGQPDSGLDAGSSDGGSLPDGGVPSGQDGGPRGPNVTTVGCGCGQPGASGVFLGLVLATGLRRRARSWAIRFHPWN